MGISKQRRSPSHFILTLRIILENKQLSDILQWDQNQGVLHIKNAAVLVSDVLPEYFRQKNLKSFVRQLNLYGFRKIIRKKQTLIFKNSQFTKQNFDQGKFIRRSDYNKMASKMQAQPQKHAIIYNCKSNSNQSSNKIIIQQKPPNNFITAIRPRIQSSCYIEPCSNQPCLAKDLPSIQSLGILNSYPFPYETDRGIRFGIFEDEKSNFQYQQDFFQEQ